MIKYCDLIARSTPYARRMNILRNRIFGDVVRPTNVKSMKVVKKLSVKPFYKDENIINYYPRYRATNGLMLKLRGYGLYRDEHEDHLQERKRLRALKEKKVKEKEN